ncbi:RICIN domain-containing protein [Deinococcus planocerae]|uniref:RICIN domain-containing protein n=1 Tax=Deinococcus planocerae TaxID=1737569 RepID=UPI000C7E8A6B|nr:RICIN domain-containing protein [Deinococcus planocerae]
MPHLFHTSRLTAAPAALGLTLLLAACNGQQAPAARAAPGDAAPVLGSLALPDSGQTYTLTNVCSGKALDISGASQQDGALAVQRTPSGAMSQQWTVTGTDAGYVRLTARHSGKALDVLGAGSANSTNAGQWSWTGSLNQHWRFEDQGNGTYELIPRHAQGMRLDVRGASSLDGAQVQIYTDNNTCAQRWRLTTVGTTETAPVAPVAAPAPTVTRRVMPLGDSITDGYNIPGGYRPELFQKLTAAALSTDFVGSLRNGNLTDRDHEGHSGWRIDEISARVDGWVDAYQPEVILLMIGTNDMIQNYDVARAPARLGALLDKINARRPAATVLVASIPPMSDATRNNRARTYNAAIPNLVQTRAAAGRKVRFVDAYPQLTLSDLADGVHPNAAGYSKLANVWMNALRGL